MEKATKEQFEKILKRCKKSIQKVEDASKTIEAENEEFRETLYALALNNLRFMLDVSFGEPGDDDYGFNLVDMENFTIDVD